MLQVVKRLKLDGIGFHPAAYHMAVLSGPHFHFVDLERQARFDAVREQLTGVNLREASRRVADEEVTLDGKRYVWQAEMMIAWIEDLDTT